MRPMFKVMMGVIVLFLLLFSYSMTQSLKTIGVASEARHESLMLPQLLRNACFTYLLEYNRFPPPGNKVLTAALLGDNSKHIVFIKIPKREINANGEVIDRWGTPFRFSFEGTTGVKIVSAGPDQDFDTADDVVSTGDNSKP